VLIIFQADDKVMKEGLTELIEKEKTKAANQASKAEKKRPAEETVKPAESSGSKRQKKKKR
jgi:hypothetical protein